MDGRAPAGLTECRADCFGRVGGALAHRRRWTARQSVGRFAPVRLARVRMRCAPGVRCVITPCCPDAAALSTPSARIQELLETLNVPQR